MKGSEPACSFKAYLKQNSTYIWVALAASLFYFLVLRLLYPVPSYFADSFTYVGAAAYNQQITFRPVMYSKLIQFFRVFSTSEIALIASQYFSTVSANLFLFFSCSYFFGFRKWQKIIVFALLILHPFHVFAANYVASDAFFTSLTVAWFTLIIWIMRRPTWYLVALHIALLFLVFTIRYNAIYFPFITAIAILFCRLQVWKKTAIMLVIAGIFFSYIIYTKNITEAKVGTRVFTAFSGWQFANNALHVVKNKKIDTSNIQDTQVKQLLAHSEHFFDTTNLHIPSSASAWYMWYPGGPLKTYMNAHHQTNGYFRNWNAVAPLYDKFGKVIVLQNTGAYIKYFVAPNTQAYLLPKLEIYETYFENVDTVAAIAQTYFKYENNRTSKHKPAVYTAVFGHWPAMFTLVNLLLLIGSAWYIFTRRYLHQSSLVNQFLVCYAAFFVANLLFIVLLAPSVLRYHITIMTIAFPIVLHLLFPQKNARMKDPASSVT